MLEVSQVELQWKGAVCYPLIYLLSPSWGFLSCYGAGEMAQELRVFVALAGGARFDSNSSSRGSTTHFSTQSTNMNIYEVGAVGMFMTLWPAYIKDMITSEAGKEAQPTPSQQQAPAQTPENF